MYSHELFLPITSTKTDLFREIEKPILAHQFSTGNSEVVLMLTDNYLVLSDNLYTKTPSHYLTLTFSVKFETIFHTYNSLGVFILIIHRKNPSATSPVLSPLSLNDNNAPRKSPFTHSTSMSSMYGWGNLKRKSTNATSTNSSRPKRKSARAPLPQSTWLKDSETTRWSPSKPSPRKSNMPAIRAETHWRMKLIWCATLTTVMWWNSKASMRLKTQSMSFLSIWKVCNWMRSLRYLVD